VVRKTDRELAVVVVALDSDDCAIAVSGVAYAHSY